MPESAAAGTEEMTEETTEEITARINALVDQLAADFRRAKLSEADRAMLEYAAKLTSEPWHMVEADVVALRQAGFNDTAILDINQVTSYFAYANRLVDGLGVELESIWHDDNV